MVCFSCKMRVSGYDFKGIAAGLFEDGEIPDEVADLQFGQSMLACAEEFARASQFKIHFGLGTGHILDLGRVTS